MIKEHFDETKPKGIELEIRVQACKNIILGGYGVIMKLESEAKRYEVNDEHAGQEGFENVVKVVAVSAEPVECHHMKVGDTAEFEYSLGLDHKHCECLVQASS